MRLEVKGKNVEVTPSLRSYAETKLAKLQKQLAEQTQVQVELSKEKNPSIANGAVAEGTIFTKGPTLRAREASRDIRASIDLPASKERSTGDDIALHDYPAAVARILEATGAESIQALVHCYGATTFFMAMLAGLKGVRSAVASQIACNVVAPRLTKVKAGLHMPSGTTAALAEYLARRIGAPPAFRWSPPTSSSRSIRPATSSAFSSRWTAPSFVIWKALRDPSPFTSSIRPMSWSMVRVG